VEVYETMGTVWVEESSRWNVVGVGKAAMARRKKTLYDREDIVQWRNGLI